MIPKVIEMEKKLTQTYLYDFYGELLTDHQREIYEDFVLNDLSLSEIAQEAGISRQGVHDLVKRCDRILEGYEEKLHLLERFLSTKEKVCRIQSLSRKYQEQREPDQRQADQKDSEKVMVMAEIEAISNEILEEL
ncbi:MAG: YlxM family DNA-binding protein [Lachnospiraceae bacterium]|nr:YlxM family DNA-binding protein [Lachnospiraceae bacterium]